MSSTGGGVYNAATKTVTWHSGKVAPGATKTFTVTARVAPSASVGEVITNRAYFRVLGVDASPLGDGDDHRHAVTADRNEDERAGATPALSRSRLKRPGAQE